MTGICYVDGRYVPHAEAHVHMEDRGYQFADGVYEVIAVYRGHLIDEGPHLDRLERSLGELGIPFPMPRAALQVVLREMQRRNRLSFGSLYMQVTRGVATRDHLWNSAIRPVVTVSARRLTPPNRASSMIGYRVISLPDLRWKRCDIKSVGLLPNILGKKKASEAGASEAWLVDEHGFVTEGTSSNAWIVTPKGELVTRYLDEAILPGITRRAILGYAARAKVPVLERAFSLDEAKAAREAFYTSATAILRPVVRIDDTVIGDGEVGALARQLASAYFDALDAEVA